MHLADDAGQEESIWRPIAKHASTFMLPLAVIVILGATWEALSKLGFANTFFFPPPSTLARTFVELVNEGFPDGVLLHEHVIATVQRSLFGFLLAISLAIPLGLVIGYFRWFELITRHLITFGRSIAPLSVLPIFVVFFGIGEVSKVSLVAFACFWATITNTIAGVSLVDKMYLRAARSMDTPRGALFWTVILPAALPRIFAGLKVSLAISFMVIVAAEMIATVYGLGTLINEARTWFRTDITMVGMAVIALIGFVASLGLDRLERRLLPWSAYVRRDQ